MQSTEPYDPPEHLRSISGLTAAQLIEQFQAFKSSLHFVSSAPEIIFERVVANLCSTKSSATWAMTQEQSSDLERLIKSLQEELRALQDDVTKRTLSEPTRLETVTCPAQVRPALVLPPSAIKFRLVPGGYGFGVRSDPIYSADGRYGAGCRWSDLQHQDSRVQFGSYNTMGSGMSGAIGACWQFNIQFSPRFTAPPTVVTWLTGVDMRCERPCHVSVSPDGIWENGSDILITPSEPGVVYSVGVSWVAFPSDQTNYSIGRFGKVVYGTCKSRGLHQRSSSKTPIKRGFVINKYARGCGGDMSFVLKPIYPSRNDNIFWGVETTKDSTAMCELGVVYIDFS